MTPQSRSARQERTRGDVAREVAGLSYQVAEQHTPIGRVTHLRVWRLDGESGISWDALQAIKAEALGPETYCVELYPPEDAVVNEANIRHLWVISDPEERLPFGMNPSARAVNPARDLEDRWGGDDPRRYPALWREQK